MLTLYRLHTNLCTGKRKQYDRDYRRCACPIHVEGMCGGLMIRQGLKSRNWQESQRRVAEAEARDAWQSVRNGQPATTDNLLGECIQSPDNLAGITLADARDKFLRDAERGKQIADVTLRKYKLLFRDLDRFAASKGYRFLAEITLDNLRSFRESWFEGTEAVPAGEGRAPRAARRPLGPRTALKKLERLRSFYRFAVDSEWVPKNLAKLVRSPSRIKEIPKLPFTPAEMERISAAAMEVDFTGGTGQAVGTVTNDEVFTFIHLLRWSGLRIGDAALLTPDRLQGDKLFLYTQKSGTHVYVPLPPFLVEHLARVPLRMGNYFFTGPGSTKVESVTDMWRRRLGHVFDAAGITKGNPHRFRHTFAVELLKKGVKTENVAVLLGHSSPRITEKHYSAWVQDRQELLEGEVAKAWPTLEVVQARAK